jgi:hypothetical protein
MKLTCKLEQERGDDLMLTSELSMYNIHLVEDIQEFFNAVQKLAGFCGVTVKLVRDDERDEVLL